MSKKERIEWLENEVQSINDRLTDLEDSRPACASKSSTSPLTSKEAEFVNFLKEKGGNVVGIGIGRGILGIFPPNTDSHPQNLDRDGTTHKVIETLTGFGFKEALVTEFAEALLAMVTGYKEQTSDNCDGDCDGDCDNCDSSYSRN